MVSIQIRVIYGDTDQMGFVYYANYLRFFEAGRSEFLREKGARYREVEEELGVYLPVVQAHVDYKRPARYDDVLMVETSLVRIGRASARFEYRVRREEEVLATGHTVHACVDGAGRVKPLPPTLVARLTPELASP